MDAVLSFHHLNKCTLTHKKKSNQKTQCASEVRGSKEAVAETVWNVHFITKTQGLQKKRRSVNSLFLRVIVCTVFWGYTVFLIACVRHGEIACVLKFKDLVAPAGPSRLEVSGKQLQAFGLSTDVGPQDVCVDQKGKHKTGDCCRFSLTHSSIHPSILTKEANIMYSGVSPACNCDDFTASRKQGESSGQLPSSLTPLR